MKNETLSSTFPYPMKSRNCLGILFLVWTISITLHVGVGSESTLPNIVLIYMDDLGYGDLVSYGAVDYQTPHLEYQASVTFKNKD